MKTINQWSLQSKLFILCERHWAWKQKIIRWWSMWSGRNVVFSRCCFHGGQFNTFVFVADFGFPTEKLAEFHKSNKRPKVFHFQFTVWSVSGSLRVCDHPGSWMKIVCTYQPLHNLLSFIYFIYAVAMLCWLILIVMWYLSHYFSFQIVLW